MQAKRSRSNRHSYIVIYMGTPDGSAERVRVPLDVDVHTLVMMAWGKFLPAGVLPSRLLRDGETVQYFNPMAKLREANAQDGDVLICEHDIGQPIEEPSLLGAYRAMAAYDHSARGANGIGQAPLRSRPRF